MVQEDYVLQIVRRIGGTFFSGVKSRILVHLLDQLAMDVICAVMQWFVGFEMCA